MSDELAEVGGDEVDGPLPLTPREERWVKLYADVESPFYGRATAAAREAGYVQPASAAHKLRRRPRIIARVAQFQKSAMACAAKIFSDLEYQRLVALAKNPPDVAAANKASELQGKHLSMFTDLRVVVDEPAVREYDARLAIEASRLARIALEEMGDRAMGLLPAEVSKPAPERKE